MGPPRGVSEGLSSYPGDGRKIRPKLTPEGAATRLNLPSVSSYTRPELRRSPVE